MSAKQIEVTCSCCGSKLLVDTLTAKILRTEKPAAAGGAAGDAWADAQRRVQGRTRSGHDKMDEALEAERGKADRLDQLFRSAREKLARGEDEG
jgi:hypothetical protein